MKHLILIPICFIFILNSAYSADEEDLKINFLPSSKYKLNKKDLAYLKEDLERQVLLYTF